MDRSRSSSGGVLSFVCMEISVFYVGGLFLSLWLMLSRLL